MPHLSSVEAARATLEAHDFATRCIQKNHDELIARMANERAELVKALETLEAEEHKTRKTLVV